MALPQRIIDALEKTDSSVTWRAILGEVRQFAAYCCNIDSDAIMGVSKEPVIVIDLSPRRICLGDSISWDMSGSYAPGSTITSRLIDMGDSNDYSSSTGSHTYADVGTYTVTVTITEGTGLSTTQEFEVNVINCSEGMFARYQFLVGSTGVYFKDWTADIPTWEARNSGLSQENWWKTETIDDSEIMAVYQPLGAADLASSYVNLVDPGTHDAAPGNAPTFDSDIGWIFDGLSDYLTTVVPEYSSWSVAIRYTHESASSGNIFGYGDIFSNNAYYVYSLPSGLNHSVSYYFGTGVQSNIQSIVRSKTNVLVLARNRIYYGLQGYADVSGVYSGVPANMFIGSRNNGGSNDPIAITVQAIAIYNRQLSIEESEELSLNLYALSSNDTPGSSANLATNVFHLDIDPRTKDFEDGYHRMIISTAAGVYISVNSGLAWTKLEIPDPSNSEFGDSPVPTVTDLGDYKWVVFDKLDPDIIYFGVNNIAETRAWVYKSVDGGVTWSSRGVTAS